MKISTFKVDNITNYYFLQTIPAIIVVSIIFLLYKINKKEYYPKNTFYNIPYEVIILLFFLFIFSTIAFYAEKPEPENFGLDNPCPSLTTSTSCWNNKSCYWSNTKKLCDIDPDVATSSILFFSLKPKSNFGVTTTDTCLSYKYPENCEKVSGCVWNKTKNSCNTDISQKWGKKSPFTATQCSLITNKKSCNNDGSCTWTNSLCKNKSKFGSDDTSYPTCGTITSSYTCRDTYNCRWNNKPAECRNLTENIDGTSYPFSYDSYNNKVYFDLLKNETLIYVTTNNALFHITLNTDGSKKYYINDDEYLYFKGVMYKIVNENGTKKYYLNNDEYKFKNGELVSVNEVKVSYLINKYIL